MKNRTPSNCLKAILLFVLFVLFRFSLISQNNDLILNGAYIKLNGGTSATPIYLVVNQPNVLGITRTSGHIISENDYNFVQWNCDTTNASYVFPFGISTTDYIPFTFNKTAGAANVSVSTYGTGADNTTFSNGVTNMGSVWGGSAIGTVIDRWWRVNATGNTADMTFSYKASENNTTTTPTDITWPQEWDNGTTAWLAPIGSGAAGVISGVGTINSGSTNSFSANKVAWVLVRADAPLPIELLYFKANWKDQHYTAALLEWETASELNNNYFEIQRSMDAVNFTTIKTVPGAGNSSQIISYSDYDNAPEKESTSYYRLKQVDYNGTYTYSNIEALNPPVGIDLITIYPNPSSEYVDYIVYSSEDAEVSVWAIDAAGKLVISEKQEIKKGINKMRMNTSNLNSGIYILKVTKDKKTKTEKQFVIK